MTRRTGAADSVSEFGGKLGPRIVDLVAQSVLATRRGLAPHEARVLAAGLQHAVDRMGAEHAEFLRPVTDALIAHGRMPPELHKVVARAASGEHQWESRALAGLLTGTAQSALGTVISNYVWPITAALVSADPMLPPDVSTLAQLVSRRWISLGDGIRMAGEQGISGTWFELMTNLSYQFVSPDVAIELIRRGVVGRAFLHEILRLQGMYPTEINAYDSLVRQWLTPADAALGVLRGNLTEAQGLAIAKVAGLERADFATLVANTGEPLGLMQLLEAYRRGFINQARLAEGIRESRVRNEWIPVAEQLRFTPMPTADAADAALRGHLTQAQAQKIAELNGLEPSDWPAYFANQGNPPAPEQLLELWRRGYIGVDLVRKGLREGRTRDEWIPTVEQLRYEPISSADAADAWLRGHINQTRAQSIMSENGLIPRDQDIALANAGNPLGLEELLEAFRRGFIDHNRFVVGFRESRYRNEWADVALKLRYRPMSTADAVEAAVQNHLTLDRAKEIALQNGLEAADFQALYQTAGSPLSRTEAEELYNRGEMSAAEVAQALRESRLKDKYVQLALKLHVRLPEARQITQMLEYGAITPAEALGELVKLGYSKEWAARFVHEAESRATGGHRQLATAQVTGMYEDQLIGRAEAEKFLEALHYTGGSARLILDLADHARRQRILNSGIAAVKAGFLHHRADDAEVSGDLRALGVPHDAIGLLIRVWTLERKTAVRQLTEAQLVKAFKRGLFDKDPAKNQRIALGRLEQLGYDQADAELLLEEV